MSGSAEEVGRRDVQSVSDALHRVDARSLLPALETRHVGLVASHAVCESGLRQTQFFASLPNALADRQVVEWAGHGADLASICRPRYTVNVAASPHDDLTPDESLAIKIATLPGDYLQAVVHHSGHTFIARVHCTAASLSQIHGRLLDVFKTWHDADPDRFTVDDAAALVMMLENQRTLIVEP